MSEIMWIPIICGLIALAYGLYAGRSVLSADAGTARMQEISAAVQEGATAYLNRQYLTIGIVGVVIFFILWFLLGIKVGVGFLIGAVLSGAAGFIGMHVSVRANVRTAAGAAKAAIRAAASPLVATEAQRARNPVVRPVRAATARSAGRVRRNPGRPSAKGPVRGLHSFPNVSLVSAPAFRQG